jgi:hypothetical protein
MKKFYITLLSSLLFVTNYATDIYVNSSGQAGTYTTIAGAISAASAGDRIYISPYGLYVEDLTVAKSLTFASSVSGVNFNVDGGMIITANAGMEVRVVGGVFSGTLTATTSNATQNNMTDVYVIDSGFSSFDLDLDFVKAHLLFCESTSNVDIINGEVIGCQLGYLAVKEGQNIGTGDTVKIIGNRLSRIHWENDDNYFMIMNNYLNGYYRIDNNYYSSNVNNIFGNNTIYYSTSNLMLIYNGSVNYSNIHLINNLFVNEYGNGRAVYIQNAPNPPKSYYNLLVAENDYWNNQGLIEVTGHEHLSNISDATQIGLTIDTYGRSTHSGVVDKGMPSIEYYDIDMTINDRGAYGGPFSIENYINNTIGKARIYDLDIPFEIWSGQTPTIKAKGAHTK